MEKSWFFITIYVINRDLALRLPLTGNVKADLSCLPKKKTTTTTEQVKPV